LPSFLTSDPTLKQVVSHTWEAGIRGGMPSYASARESWSWSIGLFHTLNDNDITEPVERYRAQLICKCR
jgi:hypothetical protein